jgi:outer membrane biosynthesis protein TonB
METSPALADQVTTPAWRPPGARRSRRSWPGVAASVLAHVAMFGGALLYARLSPPRVKAERPIVAKLVRLGEERSDKLLPRLDAASAPPPPARTSTAEAKPVPASAKPAVPVALPSMKPSPPQPAAPKADAKREAMAALDRQRRLMEALDSLGPPTTGPTGRKVEPRPGRRDGDARGTSDTATEGDRYLGLLDRALHESYVLPTTISEKERRYLVCKVFIRVARDGRLVDSRIEEPSSNPAFDRAIEGGLRKLQLPPPPREFLQAYPDGLELVFRP